ncbi:DNA helicase [Oscillospiraceae bacterium]|nr:DNA helicase [Oscillospiraceae bacterium]
MASEHNREFLTLRDRFIESRFGRLNPVQKQAVFCTEGPLLILAGAGSGKTTVLVNRIANIIRFGTAHGSDWLPREAAAEDVQALSAAVESGGEPPDWLWPMLRRDAARPWNVLAITFTNKAAGELKSRLAAMLGEEQGADVNASTFHSACVRMLRRDADRLGFPKSFTIYDTDDQQRAMKEVYKQLLVDDKFLPVKSALGQIGRMKDQLIGPEEALEAPADTKAGLVAKVYKAYADRLRSAGAMDFDDLIYHTVCLFQDHPDVLEYYQKKYRYVLVDEYQDTSVAQFQLVRLLAGGYKNVCVVGDDDQSIYRFRGATIENILNFEQHFQGAKVIRLEQNYRSTACILNAANCVIRNNQGRKGKTLWTQNGEGEKIHHYLAENEQDEASQIATVIGQNLKNGARLRDHAVLYRMNAQSGPVETYFARAGIPYKIVGGQRFYDRKEVKDIIAYMSIVANPSDDLRLRRIINEPARKIGGTTLDKMADIAAGLGVSLLQVCEHAADYPAISRAANALHGFWGIYQQLLDSAESQPLDVFVSDILELTGYQKMLEAQGDEGAARLENLGQLVSSVKTYADQRGPEASLAGFLEEVALISDIDSYDEETDVVVMMTMHAAKGLEFDYVFILGLEEGIFPSELSRYSDEDLEEERRLCYVGITRARKELYLSSSQSRMIFGQTRRNRPSRFLEEIEPELVDQTESPAIARHSFGGFGSFGGSSYSQGGHAFGAGGFGGAQGAAARQWGGSGWGAGQGAKPSGAGAGPFGGPTVGRPAAPVPAAGGAKRGYRPGDKVEHKVFGRGVVLKATPAAGDTIVEIQFEKAGVKKTMANYAPLTLLEE